MCEKCEQIEGYITMLQGKLKAVEFKFADGKKTGFWYCSECRTAQTNATPVRDSWNSRSKFTTWQELGLKDSDRNKARAEQCCTQGDFRPTLCTGCRTMLRNCKCGRAKKNPCTGCGKKLWLKEGQKIKFGVGMGEFCRECAPKLLAKLVDAGK